MNISLLIVGLGNPGKKYEETYHNAGFLFLDAFLARCAPASRVQWKKPARASFSYAVCENKTLVKPEKFMNESGQAVQEALAWFKIPQERLLVVHDESDLPIGTWRFSEHRGAAGHNGVRSIIESLGTTEFQRLRIGIRPPENGTPVNIPSGGKHRKKAADFVLSRISSRDRDDFYRSLDDAAMKLIEKV